MDKNTNKIRSFTDLIARDVGYLSKEEFDKIAKHSIEVSKITNGLIKKSKLNS